MSQQGKVINEQDSRISSDKSLSEQSEKMQGIDVQKPKNSTTYYVVTTLYCIFLTITGLIIAFAPESWIAKPEVAMILNAIASRMPGLVNLVSIAESPQVILFGYCMAFITMPIHIFLLTIITASRYNNGFFTMETMIRHIKWYWIYLLLTWAFNFTCTFCDIEPNWRAYMLVSSRNFVAFIGQFWAASCSLLPGMILVIILGSLRKCHSNQLQDEGKNVIS